MKKSEENDLLEKLKHNAEGWQNAVKEKDEWQAKFESADKRCIEMGTKNAELWDKFYVLEREKRDFDSKTEKFKKILLEQGTRSRNKLMSVYFLLGTIKKMGTHHEKAVAVSFLMQTVDDLVKGEDHLSWDQDLVNDLPF
jgi:hypothetical protein